ncbi:MAG: hypothetical protein IJX90_10635 [Blautia sp.]|nr:hypothetical protein [Blautia sp.]
MDLQTQIGSNINLDLPVNRLDVVEKYTVELMRLAVLAPEVIVIDYILSFLGYYEYNTFCNLLSVMKEKGCTVIILTNRWEDMLGICSEFILYNRIHDSYTVIATEEVQKNPQKLFLELMGYENQESSATLVSTLNAISGIVELFDTGKNLETEITKLTDIAKSNLKASSCIVYLQGFDNKIISYYKRLLA